jgi:hypothetical protein
MYMSCVNEPPRRLCVDTSTPRNCLPPSYRDPVSPSLLPSGDTKLSGLPFCGPAATRTALTGGRPLPEIPSLPPSYGSGDSKLSPLPPCGPAVTRTASTGGRPLPEIPRSVQERRLASLIPLTFEPVTSPPAYELHSAACMPLLPHKQALQEPGPPEYLPFSEHFIPREAVSLEASATAVFHDQIDHALPPLTLHETICVKDIREDISIARELEIIRGSDSSAREVPPAAPQGTTSKIPAAKIGAACGPNVPVGGPCQINLFRRDPASASFPSSEVETASDIREVLRCVVDLQLIVARQAKEIERLARIVVVQHPSQHGTSASALQHQLSLPTAGTDLTDASRLVRGPQH